MSAQTSGETRDWVDVDVDAYEKALGELGAETAENSADAGEGGGAAPDGAAGGAGGGAGGAPSAGGEASAANGTEPNKPSQTMILQSLLRGDLVASSLDHELVIAGARHPPDWQAVAGSQ